ncbi:MAG: D-glycero-beta-D-manno-heptose 1-phosphate adenylyltransferase [Bacteroidetes bacterium]|nr:MAG: D-glycero-beta-D-manno-heptose 1-phosphate adenylyltransferase [Bacteroidota bacterium]TAG87644.1 MAG: D-glycero-beta-D-manno-heptose 1-phosphate adenylyltransferase [Bacteroidota bacterium]
MTKNKIASLENLLNWREIWKKNNQKVVFTNGCFDIVHLGHIDYLEKAKQKGDKLVVGLNSDASVKRIKGQKRPIIPQYARLRMLAAMEFVDAVVLFEEDTPEQLIEKICPDMLVKGSDYEIKNIVGSDFVIANGGKVETLDLVDGFSTSNIIQKIKEVENL